MPVTEKLPPSLETVLVFVPSALTRTASASVTGSEPLADATVTSLAAPVSAIPPPQAVKAAATRVQRVIAEAGSLRELFSISSFSLVERVPCASELDGMAMRGGEWTDRVGVALSADSRGDDDLDKRFKEGFSAGHEKLSTGAIDA